MFDKLKKVWFYISFVLFFCIPVSATDAPIIATVQWIGQGLSYIGAVLALFGAIQFAMAFANEDAEQKLKGLKFMLGGGLLWGGTTIMTLFYGLDFRII